MTREAVLVTGVGGPSGVAAVAALKSRGFTVTGVDMRPVLHAADSFFQVPAALNPAYVPVLLKLAAAQKVSWLVPTVSEELIKIAQAADDFRRGGVSVYIGEPGPVRICNDKWETARALERAGVAVPRTAIGNADSATVRSLRFPVVSRPRVGRGGRDVVVHEGPGVAPTAWDPVWQEFMPGTEYDVLIVVHPDPRREPTAIEVFEKKILKDGRVGNALEIERSDAPDVARLACSAAAAVGLRGPMDIDIRRDASGLPRLLEINARIGAHALKAPAIFDALVRLHREGHRG